MSFFSNLFKSPFDRWLEAASDEELKTEYERQRLIESGLKTSEMRMIDNELVRRANERYEKEYPDAEARHREHGWYLPNDD